MDDPYYAYHYNYYFYFTRGIHDPLGVRH